MASSPHNIVVLGGNLGGVGSAHYILRHIIPSLAASTGKTYKLTLVSPSTHFYWKIAAPRGISSPSDAPKIFEPFLPEFKTYGSKFAFVQGTATGLSAAAKSIIITAPDGKEVTISYDSLILATGTTSNSPLWTFKGPHTVTLDAFTELHGLLPKAKTILIGGGGAAGIETAGEIAYKYTKAEVTLLSGGPYLLPRLTSRSVGKSAESKLKSLKVKVVHDVRVISSTTSRGKTLLKFSNGTSKEVDIYIDATGGKPNTSFLPSSWLDNAGRVVTDGQTLRATAAPAGVYALGDVASYSKSGIMDVFGAVQPLGYSLWTDLGGVTGLKEKKYAQSQTDMQFIPIGPKGGVGTAFGWSVPSMMVRLAKSRTFFIEKTLPHAKGAIYANVDVNPMG